MHATDLLEQQLADAWPAMVDERLGEWRLRAAAGFTGRANSAITVGDPGIELTAALRTVIRFAEIHRIQPRAHVVIGSAVEDDLLRNGWCVNSGHPAGSEVSVLTRALSGLRGDARHAAVHSTPPAGWWQLTADTTHPTPAQRQVLAGGSLTIGFATYRIGDTLVGAARGALAGDILHVARLAVREEYRRRGVGSALMAALGRWGSAHGASRCALQVAVDNTSALTLYRTLDFIEHHRYRYWIPAPKGTCEDRRL